MEVYWQGVDITAYANMRSCVMKDTAGERCDILEIEFENAAGWFSWGPEADDTVRVTHNGYDTGLMYLNAVLPEEGIFRIMATSLPCKARKKEWRSFTGKSIEEIMRVCAVSSGMDYQIFGIDGDTIIPYIQQANESCASFLARLLRMEGAVLKCVNGKYTAIGIEYAQDKQAGQTFEIDLYQEDVTWYRSGAALRSLRIMTPYCDAMATDTGVDSSHSTRIVNAPARNNVQAGRWARGMLLSENRQCEKLTMLTQFNAGFTSMARIDTTGETPATGEWIIQDSEHDFINLKSSATMYRCLTTIQ